MKRLLTILLGVLGLSLFLVSPVNATPTAHPLDGRIHGWQYGNISVEDHTSSNFLVYAQVNYTRNITGGQVPIYYINNSIRSCAYYASQGSPNCIKTYNGNYGATGWLGRTLTEDFRALTGEMVPITIVQFNSYYLEGNGPAATAHARNVTLCHEIGHAVGLWYHRPDTDYVNSCMVGNGNLANYTYTGFNSLDIQYLQNWY